MREGLLLGFDLLTLVRHFGRRDTSHRRRGASSSSSSVVVSSSRVNSPAAAASSPCKLAQAARDGILVSVPSSLPSSILHKRLIAARRSKLKMQAVGIAIALIWRDSILKRTLLKLEPFLN